MILLFIFYKKYIFNIRIFLSRTNGDDLESLTFRCLPVLGGINMSRCCKTATNDSFWFKFKFSIKIKQQLKKKKKIYKMSNCLLVKSRHHYM